MTQTSYPHPAVEAHLIHRSACRYRRQQLACSTCSDLAERAARVLAAMQQIAKAA